jgi:glycosyltransferase involved in cell wall biosynthesis
MKIIIIASDIHIGGGKVMLNDLLDAAIKMREIDFHVIVDSRYEKEKYISKNIFFTEISKWQRIFYVNRVVKSLVNSEDIVLNISDLPAFKRFNCIVIQYIMNRYFIDNYSTSGLPIVVRLRLAIEKLAFTFYLKNADYIFVQNLVMQDLLLNLGYSKEITRVIPYKNVDNVYFSQKKIHNSFIYVASGEIYKNHLNLITAWSILAEEGIYPTLFITIDDNTLLYEEISNQIQKYKLKIFIKPKLQRDELLSYYGKVSALIYPSFFECFGIPLLEASNFNLPIIASELDYVRDLIDPEETFDPQSPRSISRAVKRFLKHEEKRNNVLTAEAFNKELILYAKKQI